MQRETTLLRNRQKPANPPTKPNINNKNQETAKFQKAFATGSLAFPKIPPVVLKLALWQLYKALIVL